MNHGFSPSKSHKRLLTSDKPGIREIKEETKEETTPNHRIHPTPLHKQAHSAIAISNDSTHIFTVTQQRIAYAMLLRASQRELPRPPHKAEVSVVSVKQSPVFFQRCANVNNVSTRAVDASRDPTDKVSSIARPNTDSVVLIGIE